MSNFPICLTYLLMYKKSLPHRLENWGSDHIQQYLDQTWFLWNFLQKQFFFRYIFSFGENRTLLGNNDYHFLMERFPAVNNWLDVTLFSLFTTTVRTIRISRWKHSLNHGKAELSNPQWQQLELLNTFLQRTTQFSNLEGKQRLGPTTYTNWVLCADLQTPKMRAGFHFQLVYDQQAVTPIVSIFLRLFSLLIRV